MSNGAISFLKLDFKNSDLKFDHFVLASASTWLLDVLIVFKADMMVQQALWLSILLICVLEA